MSGKRKQCHAPRDELESDWETIVDAQRRAKSGKLQVEAPSKEVFIITELVEFNEKKHRYIPVPYIKERQYVKLDGAYTYENLYSSTWNHYSEMEDLGIDTSTHTMSFLVGPKGPRAKYLVQLKGQENILVVFEKKKSSAIQIKPLDITPSSTVSSFAAPSPVTLKQSSASASTHHNSSTASTHSGVSNKRETSSIEGPIRPIINVPPVPVGSIKKSIMPPLKFTMEDLMTLGRKVPEVNWAPAKIRSLVFDPATAGFAWSNWSPIRINKGTLIAKGGFREAYRCTTEGASDLRENLYVLKTFLPAAVSFRRDNILLLNTECTEANAAMELNMKAVQSLSLAKILSDLFRERFEDDVSLPRYVSSWLVEFDHGDFGTVEEYIEGDFVKYINNSMDENEVQASSDCALKAIAFAHFTYEYGEGTFMITDLQGVGVCMTDPEVATKRSFELKGGKGEMVFGAGNMPVALDYFVETHKCNEFCRMANLKPLRR